MMLCLQITIRYVTIRCVTDNDTINCINKANYLFYNLQFLRWNLPMQIFQLLFYYDESHNRSD